jgi:hypothetical protein
VSVFFPEFIEVLFPNLFNSYTLITHCSLLAVTVP